MTTKDNSWVLITGASSGFGEEFARQYAEQGHSLVLVARRLDRLQALAEALRRQYRIDVVVEQVDLSDIAAVIQLHQRLREQGIAIDILINNAGHGLQGPFVDMRVGLGCVPAHLTQLLRRQWSVVRFVLRQHLDGQVVQRQVNRLRLIDAQPCCEPRCGLARHAGSAVGCTIAERNSCGGEPRQSSVLACSRSLECALHGRLAQAPSFTLSIPST